MQRVRCQTDRIRESGRDHSARACELQIEAPCGCRRGDRVKRRDFITLVGGAAATWPVAARAQQSEQMRRIGVVAYWPAEDPEGQARLAAFAQALKQLGWSDGRNLRIDTRS